MLLLVSFWGEFLFYVTVILSAALIIVAAWSSFNHDYKTAENALRKRTCRILFICGLLGALLAMLTSVSEHLESNSNQAEASKNDSLYKQLLTQSLADSRRIIDTSQTILHNSRDMLQEQSTASTMLLQQLNDLDRVLGQGRVLQAKNENIIRLQQNLLGAETGGDGFPLLHFEIQNDTLTSYELYNPGNFPFYGLDISVEQVTITKRPVVAWVQNRKKVELGHTISTNTTTAPWCETLTVPTLLPQSTEYGKTKINHYQKEIMLFIQYNINKNPAFIQECYLREPEFYGENNYYTRQTSEIRGIGIYSHVQFSFTDNDFYLPGEKKIVWQRPIPKMPDNNPTWRYKNYENYWKNRARVWYEHQK